MRHTGLVFQRSGEQPLCRCTSRYQSSVTKHETTFKVQRGLIINQRTSTMPMMIYKLVSGPPLKRLTAGGQLSVYLDRENFKRAKTHWMGLQPFYSKRPHPLLWAGPRACLWKNSNKWNTGLICCDIFKVYTICNCGRGSETHDAVGTADTEVL